MANALGAFIGPAVGGLIAYYTDWRVPFIIFFFPTIVFVILGMRLKEPGRGHFERGAAGAEQAIVDTDEAPPSWAESVRILWQVRTLRRIWFSLPFLAASVIGLATLTNLYYEEVFGLNEAGRGFVGAISEPAQIVGIILGIPLASTADAEGPRPRTEAALDPRHRHRRCLDHLRARAVALGGGGVQHRHLGAFGAPRARHLRVAVARDPAEGPLARVLDGVAVRAARPRHAHRRRRDRRPLRHPHRHADHGAGVPHRRVHPVVGLGVREVRHQQGVDLDGGPGRSALPTLEGRSEAAARPQRRRQLRQRAGALRRQPRDRRGRDHRVARHERRREIDAVEGDRGSGRGRRGRDRVRRPRRDVRTAVRDRGPGHRDDPGRAGRVPIAQRRREPAPRGLARQGSPQPRRRGGSGRSNSSPCSALACRSPRPTSAAASSRC